MQAEIRIGDFRFYSDLEVLDEFFKDNGGSGGMPIAVGTDIINDPFDFFTCAGGGIKKDNSWLSGILFIGFDGFIVEFANFT
jgi:hypothetical protein